MWINGYTQVRESCRVVVFVLPVCVEGGWCERILQCAVSTIGRDKLLI